MIDRTTSFLVGIIAVGTLAVGADASADDHSWHLLTQTHGGTVSLLKDLTQHECEFARARALGLPATDEEKAKDEDRRKHEAERYNQTHPTCPPIDATKADWEKWHKVHPSAVGCKDADGHGATEWTFTTLPSRQPRDITSAECFQ